MTTVVVAEKPSVARDLARVLGARTRREGYLEGNGYRVTWALGHLVQFAEPDAYGPDWAGRWSLAQLPMLPARWRLRVLPKTTAQFNVIKALLTAADTERVVCATDAGREGELIFRLIAEHARCRRPLQRLWVSSLTDEAIRAGLARLRPGTDYAPLAAAARARAQADWLIGMNLTRAYSVHNGVLCTIGRVQTPTLAMICARDAAIEAFTKTIYFELIAHLLTAAGEAFTATWSRDGQAGESQRIASRAEAERLQRALAPSPTGTITAVERQVRRQRPPPLYDLTSLQRDANRRFGFTAARTLELAQALYETHKLISYPRTESRHIGEDLLPQLPQILRALDHPLAGEALARLDAGHRLGKAYVDQTKLTDHHAILPTTRAVPPGLERALRQVYDLIATRFVAVFLPEAQTEETRVTVAIGDAVFLARGSRVLDLGWRRAEPRHQAGARSVAGAAAATGAAGGDPGSTDPPRPDADTSTDDRALPPLAKGQVVAVQELAIVEKETEPPRPYDDASLLAAMRNAGREIEDEALAQAMKASGLGTPATRAEIIEKLIRSDYVERQRKQLRATPKGRALIPLVAEPLRSPELTAAWEQRLKDIEEGRAEAATFYRDICTLISDLIPQVAAGPALGAEARAAAQAARGAKGAKGSGGRGGRSARGRKGSRTTAVSSAAGAPGGTCPICGQGEITENSRAWGCSRYREGCAFTIWKTVAGHTLTPDERRQLLEQRVTAPIDDLRSRAGRAFRARLRLDESGKVGFDFEPGETGAEGPAETSGERRSEADGEPGAETRADRRAEPDAGAASRSGARAQPRPKPGTAAASLSAAPIACPRCGQGRIIEGHRGYGCNRYRDGCDFVVWKETAGHRLDPADLRTLLTTGRLGPLPDLIGADGARHPGWLRLGAGGEVTVVTDNDRAGPATGNGKPPAA